MSKAKGIRGRVVGTKAKPGLVVKFGEDEIEVREPNNAKRSQILSASGGEFEDGKAKLPNMGVFIVNVLIECAYVPGTAERVFEPEDFGPLMAMGSELDPLLDAAMAAMNPGGPKKLGNESGATPS